MTPVLRLRVVDAEQQALLATGVPQLPDYVAMEGRGVHHVVIGHLAVPHGKTIVVLRGDDDVSHASFLCDPRPLVGTEFSRVEHPGNLLAVLRDGDPDVVHQPLAIGTRAASLVLAAECRVDPEMQEQTEGGLAPARQRRRLLRWGGVRHEGRRLGAQCTLRLSLCCSWGSRAERADREGGEHGCNSHPDSRGHAFQRPRSLLI
jgi:hypothetical protein